MSATLQSLRKETVTQDRQNHEGMIMQPLLESVSDRAKEPDVPLWVSFFCGGLALGVAIMCILNIPGEHMHERPSPLACGLCYGGIAFCVSLLAFSDSTDKKHSALSSLWFSFLLGIGILLPFIPWHFISLCF